MSRGRKGYYMDGDKKDKKYYMAQRRKEREARISFVGKYLHTSRIVNDARLSSLLNDNLSVEKFLYHYSNETDLSPTTLSSVFRQGFSNHIPRFMVNPSILPVGKRVYGDGTFINIFPISKNTFSNSYSRLGDMTACLFSCWEDNSPVVKDGGEGENDYNPDSIVPEKPKNKLYLGKMAILKLIGYCKVCGIRPEQITYDLNPLHTDDKTFEDCGKALGYVVDVMLSSVFSNFTFSQDIVENKDIIIPKLRESISSSLLNLVGILDYKSLKMVIASNVISILLSVNKVSDEIIEQWRLPTNYIEGMFSYALNYEDSEKENNPVVNDYEDD